MESTRKRYLAVLVLVDYKSRNVDDPSSFELEDLVTLVETCHLVVSLNKLADDPTGRSRTDAEIVQKKFDEKKNDCREISIKGFVLGFIVRGQVLKRFRNWMQGHQ